MDGRSYTRDDTLVRLTDANETWNGLQIEIENNKTFRY